MRENDIGTQVLQAAIHIHRELGPGLLETLYEFILLNFGEAVLKSGITRCVNRLEE